MNPVAERAYAILSRLGANPVGAELGVSRGALSRRLLTRKDLHLIMVDTWGVYRPTYAASDDWHAERTTEEQASHRASAETLTRFAEDRRSIIAKDTLDAAKGITDGSLDFVFVDADHSYAGCMADIEAWAPKIKAGGLLCGHDFHAPNFPKWGVEQAVSDYARMRRLSFEVGADDTWFMRMPGPVPEASTHYDQVVICCVRWGKKYGAEYVNVLADMVERNIESPVQFWCFTDDPAGLDDGIVVQPIPTSGLPGWWSKLRLFATDAFPKGTRVIYLDLDVAVTGALEPLIDQKGIAADWLQGGYNSSVMVWDHGEHSQIWSTFKPTVMDELHGDQNWIERVSTWACLPPDWIVSYRLHAQEWPPVGAKIVAFHGAPKPHEVKTGWVPEIWTMDGLAEPRYVSKLNNDITAIRANVETNKENAIPAIKPVAAHTGVVCIVGGGPSLADDLVNLQFARHYGAEIWALNGVHDYLIDRRIIPDAMVMLDSRPENAGFVCKPHYAVQYMIATQCDPTVFAKLECYDVRKWTAWAWGIEDDVIIGGGATVGLKAMCLAYVLGYRRFKIFGFDSSYRATENHAYRQPMNDTEAMTDVVVQGERFTSAKWMVRQVREFQDQAKTLMDSGCTIEVYGSGLLPAVCRAANRHQKETVKWTA